MIIKKTTIIAGIITACIVGSVIAAVNISNAVPNHTEYAVRPDKQPTPADREAVPASASPEAQHFSNGADTNPHSNPHTNETNIHEDR
jgi:hypothetical protein